MSGIIKNRSEILFLYEIENANPNGNPMDENRPRFDSEDSTALVSDVRIKRTIRDYWQEYKGYNGKAGKDIFVREKTSFQQATNKVLLFTKETYTGIEIDLDAIENVLSSAISPTGFSVVQARQFVHQAASKSKVAYLHICEGASILDNGQKSTATGKLISYLVTDFIKAAK